MENFMREKVENCEREEANIEAFFALMRTFREARDRRRDELRELITKNDEGVNYEKRRKIMEDNKQPIWVPSFQPEDFANIPLTIKKNKNGQEGFFVGQKVIKDDGPINLKLSL